MCGISAKVLGGDEFTKDSDGQSFKLEKHIGDSKRDDAVPSDQSD